jgi:hypothetical protein
MANKTIKVAGKAIEFTVETVKKSTVKFADGVIGELPTPASGVVSIAAATKLYSDVKASAPVIIKPIKIIGKSDFAALRAGVEGEVLQLKPDVYSDRLDLENLKDVTLQGNGKVSFETGGRAFQMNNNSVHGLTMSGLNFKDINDYVIDFWGAGNLKYTGKEDSFINGLTLTDITAENCGTLLHVDGGITGADHFGVLKNLVIKGMVFKNSPEPRSVIYGGNLKGYDISDCVVDNINYSSSLPNAPQGAHNGIFQLGGNGRFYNNRITNHQGNVVRSWLFSQDETAFVDIFNNIVFNSSTYSAFELQATMSNQIGFKPANAKVYNNTAGSLNKWNMADGKKYFEGQMLDLYSTRGTLEYYGNLGFDLNRQSGEITDMINFNGDAIFNRKENNKYCPTWKEAVTDLSSFKSKLTGVGAQ